MVGPFMSLYFIYRFLFSFSFKFLSFLSFPHPALPLPSPPFSLPVQLSTNPYHYDSHVQLISLARSAGDLDAARKAREAMHQVYPLTEGTG